MKVHHHFSKLLSCRVWRTLLHYSGDLVQKLFEAVINLVPLHFKEFKYIFRNPAILKKKKKKGLNFFLTLETAGITAKFNEKGYCTG